MIHLLVENCYGLERIARAAVRIVATSSVDHDVVNVFRHKIAITGDFRLQKELTKAIEGHGVSALIVLREFYDRNNDDSPIGHADMRRRLRR